MTSEALARVAIDQRLRDAGWPLDDGVSVRFEHPLTGGGRADYVLFDRQGRALAVLEAKRASVHPGEGEAQAARYAEALGVPFLFVSNGEWVRFRDLGQDAHFREVDGLFSQDDLIRRRAAREIRRDPMSLPIDARIAGGGGRVHQSACIDVLTREIASGRRKLLVEMATGTGKTRTAAALIKRLFQAGWASRVLFVVDRTTLAIQAEDAFSEHLPDIPSYRVPRVGRRFQDEKRITIVTLQTLINDYDNYTAGYFDLIVIDECHRSIYGQYRRAIDHFDAVKIGLTATPCVAPPMNPALTDFDDEDAAVVRDTLRFFEVKTPTYSYTIGEAIADGWLAPYEIYRALTVRTAAEDGFEVRREEIDWDALDPEGRAELAPLFEAQDSIIVDPTALERRFSIPERNRAIVREFKDVLERGYVGPGGVRRAPQPGKTIVFAVTKRHAQTLARLFDEAFAHEKPSPTERFADFVVSGQGPDDTVDAQAKIKRFKKEPLPAILVSVNMLDTGFDAPEVRNLVMARFTHSAILYRQMRGRGSRLSPGKDRFTIWDFTGVTRRHGDEESPNEGGAVVVREPGPLKAPAGRRLLMLDIHDEIDPATREWVTVDESGRAHLDPDEARREGLGAAFEAWLASQTLDADQRRLLHLVKEQIKANAGEMAAFDSWRFDAPPLSMNGGFERARAVFGGEAELERMLTSLNAAVFSDGASESPSPLVGEGLALSR